MLSIMRIRRGIRQTLVLGVALASGCASLPDGPISPAPKISGDVIPAIRLVTRTFVAPPGIDNALLRNFEVNDVDELHAIVQFIEPLTHKRRSEFERQHSVRLLNSIPDNAFFALVPRSALRNDRILRSASGERILRTVLDISATDKIAPRLLAGQIGKHAVRTGNFVAVTLQFHIDIEENEAESVLRSHGLKIVERIPLINAVQTEISRDRFLEVGSEDSVKWINEIPKPAEDDNDTVRSIKGVNSDWEELSNNYNLTGAGVTIGQWETSVADATHGDLSTGITYTEPGAIVGDHPTHVAGTAIGTGVQSAVDGDGDPQWQGVAPGAKIRSYDEDNLDWEYINATSNGVTISNNSWGTDHCHELLPGENCYDQGSASYDTAISARQSDGQPATDLAHRVLILGSSGNEGRIERHTDDDNDISDNGQYDVGEYIVVDRDEDGLLTKTGSDQILLLGSTPVSELPNEVKLADFRPEERHTETGIIPGDFENGEGAYRDVDMSGDVSVNDVRLTNTAYGATPSTVAYGDGDVGDFLRPFNNWNNVRIPNSAKNTILVGAYNTDDGSLWKNSSRGPTTDGRLKPDVVAPGSRNNDNVGITSTTKGNAYADRSGTSTSTPAVTGVAALLSEWYKAACRVSAPYPSTLRAILLHTAKDVKTVPGFNAIFTGPDYASGYGKVNAPMAVDVVPHHVEKSIDFGSEPDSFELTIGQVQNLKVTLAWDDPPWDLSAAQTPFASILQNDLDLEIESPNGTIYTPWLLDPENPSQPAVQSSGYLVGPVPESARDRRNTVEQVVVPNAMAGTWTIRVIASSTRVGALDQDYSLVSDLLEPQFGACNPSPTTDVWLRDNLTDIGTTPSSGSLWFSPDVWNRASADNGTEHQNPIYGQDNALYVELRNRSSNPGASAKASSIDLWIAQASTGLRWPNDFSYVGRLPAPNLGYRGSRVIGPLLWRPPRPNPSDHFCLYVRAVSPQDPITITETSSVANNTAMSNNIVWKNVNVVYVFGTAYVTFLTRNIEPREADIQIQVRIPEEFFSSARLTLTMAPKLYRQWRESDNLGRGFVAELEQLPRDADLEALEKLSRRITLNSPEVLLGPIQYKPLQHQAVSFSISSTSEQQSEYPVDVIQLIDGKVVGGIRYLVHTGRPR